MRRHVGGLVALCIAPLALGCLGPPKVVRVYDGRLVEGEYVSAAAYAAYLTGALAEASGDLGAALNAYERAAKEDESDPEPITRVADVRCQIDPKDARADGAFARALRIDATYAPLLAARARCLSARGDAEGAVETLEKIAVQDRTSVTHEALFVRLAARRANSPEDRSARARAIALTLESGGSPAAWEALVAWGRGKADGELFARGLEGLVRVTPARSVDVESGVLELLGSGHASLARRVAAHLADAPSELGISRVHDPTVARLAIDEALLAEDAARAERRAVRGHVPLSEVAARALLLERPEIATSITRTVLEADPSSAGASMVSAALWARDDGTPPAAARERLKVAPMDRPSATCVFLLAERLSATSGVDAARTWVSRVATSPMVPHDPVTGPLAVDLAARGVLDDKALPLELRLELAARRREPPPAIDVAAIESRVVDAKHALLWHLLLEPQGSQAARLLSKMHVAAERDPIIGFALARAALAAEPAIAAGSDAWVPVLRAIAASPSHPLLLAVAVEVAQKFGRSHEIPPARTRLMAVASTPAERALASE